MPIWLTDAEFAVLSAACDRSVPATEDGPGAVAAGVPDYIDGLLGAFTVDPPRIWAGGPTSGRYGGEAAFARFHPLSPLDELAWRIRIEGSRVGPSGSSTVRWSGCRSGTGPGWPPSAPTSATLDGEEQDARLAAADGFAELLYRPLLRGACTARPSTGGTADGAAWEAIGFAGDVQPRGWTDAEVSEP